MPYGASKLKMCFQCFGAGRTSAEMSQDKNQHVGDSPLPDPEKQNSGADCPAYGEGPFHQSSPETDRLLGRLH
jgi:hypothetical protein